MVMTGNKFTYNALTEDLFKKQYTQNTHIRMLRYILLQLANICRQDEMYCFLGRCFLEAVPKSIVIINSYDACSNLFQLQGIYSDNFCIDQYSFVRGVNPVGMSLPISDSVVVKLMDGNLKVMEKLDELFTASADAMSRNICNIVEEYISIKRILGIGFVFDNKLFGNSYFLLNNLDAVIDNELVEAIASIAGLALSKYQK